MMCKVMVSEACQINDLDHSVVNFPAPAVVSEACQINDLDHFELERLLAEPGFRSLSDQ